MMAWVKAAAVFGAVLSALWAAKKILFWYLRRWARRTETELDDLLLRTLSAPLSFLLVGLALLGTQPFLPVSEKTQGFFQVLFKAAVLAAAVFLADRLAITLFQRRKSRSEAIRTSSGLIKILLHTLVIGVGGLMILDSIGVSITPLLASLGVGSLAVALALQDTLSNFFSGVYLALERPLEVGHYVKLESGEEGYVEKIGWRSTRIRMLPNNVVVIPNSKLATGHFTNFYLPEKELAVLVQVGVSYGSDLKKVEAVTIEVGREVLRSVKGGVPGFEPFIRYHTFGDSSINFTVILRAAEYVDQYLLKHEFIKALHERYRKEGIVIPFPLRTLDLPAPIDVRLASRG